MAIGQRELLCRTCCSTLMEYTRELMFAFAWFTVLAQCHDMCPYSCFTLAFAYEVAGRCHCTDSDEEGVVPPSCPQNFFVGEYIIFFNSEEGSLVRGHVQDVMEGEYLVYAVRYRCYTYFYRK